MHFNPNKGLIGKVEKWETPDFIADFWEWITGEPEEPKHKFKNPFN